MTNVLVVDDHPIVLQGCRRVLEDLGACSIREANTLPSAYRTFRKIKPDLIIIDLGMNGRPLGGIDLIRRLRFEDRDFGILVFSMHNDPTIVRRALDAGANGYVMKDSPPSELREAIEKVRRRQSFLNHTLALEVALLGVRNHPDPLDDLTPRELQVLSLLAEGHQYGSIAETLDVSYKTVANTCSQIKAKLAVTTLPQLIRKAVTLMGTEASETGGARGGRPRSRAS
ncbi:response regulator [Methyloraptor flagellatus]|jgi:DNA-binding NarL/FixJ family response regulator|uniref:Response regulator transcription factor n=1 Tax=Methyloraptor flagellatus TaxID=3162530 RepID=A0AAU7X6C2_9HYPH